MRTVAPALIACLAFCLPGSVHAETVAEVLRAPVKGQNVQLQGTFTGKKNAATWRFQDKTGEILVDIEEDNDLSTAMKRGGLTVIQGTLSKPFGSKDWEVRLEEARIQVKTIDMGKAAHKSPRKPFRLLPVRKKPTELAPQAAARSPQAAARTTSITELLKAPGAGSVQVSGTIMEVVSPQKILLWDGRAAMAVRLDQLSGRPKLARAQRITVLGTPVREGEALVELNATSIR